MRRAVGFAIGCALAVVACGGGGKPKPRPARPIANHDVSTPRPPAPIGDGAGGTGYGGTTYGGAPHDDPKPPAVETRTLSGRWIGRCEPGAKGEHTRQTLEANDTHWDLRTEAFTDAACTKRRSTVRAAGDYVIAATPTSAGWAIELAVATRDITADDKKTAFALGKACGVKLAAGVAGDILAKGCPARGIKPHADCPTEYDVAELGGGILHLGQRPADGDVCSTEHRPSAVASFDLIWRWRSVKLAECDALGPVYEQMMACAKVPIAIKEELRRSMAAMWSTWGDSGVPAELAETCNKTASTLPDDLKKRGC